jgi:hypothetical protein
MEKTKKNGFWIDKKWFPKSVSMPVQMRYWNFAMKTIDPKIIEKSMMINITTDKITIVANYDRELMKLFPNTNAEIDMFGRIDVWISTRVVITFH